MSIDDVFVRLDAAARAVAGAPWAVHALVSLATVCGLVLWLAGARVLRPMMIVLGALVFAGVGFVIGPALANSAETAATSAPHPTAGAYGLLIGLPVGALVGVVLYRSATAVALGLALGAAAPLCAAGLLHLHVLPTGQVLSARDARPMIAERAALVAFDEPMVNAPLPESLPIDWEDALRLRERFAPAAGAAREAIEHTRKELTTRWEAVPTQHRAVLALSSLGGLALGIVLGLAAPAWAAGSCAAMLGSALWLAGGVWLSGSLGASWAGAGGPLDRTPMQWLTVWGFAAAAGLCAQCFFAWRKRA